MSTGMPQLAADQQNKSNFPLFLFLIKQNKNNLSNDTNIIHWWCLLSIDRC
jgi:hypothetical protein